MTVKEKLYKHCFNEVKKRLHTIELTISSNQKALESETKSSAGDKHETGRAMLQLEMEKAGQQLANIKQMQETLAKINVDKPAAIAHLGSVIYTDTINYFLAISCGQLTVANKKFFAVSVSSPIGKILLGKKQHDVFTFKGKPIQITKIE